MFDVFVDILGCAFAILAFWLFGDIGSARRACPLGARCRGCWFLLLEVAVAIMGREKDRKKIKNRTMAAEAEAEAENTKIDASTKNRSRSQSSSKSLHDIEARGEAETKAPELFDPDWHDIEAAPPVEEFTIFDPPNDFKRKMMSEKHRWMCGSDTKVALAIANVTSTVVMPRLADFECWRANAVDFFRRLCCHRRVVQEQTCGAIDELREAICELRERHSALRLLVTEQDKRLRFVEQQPAWRQVLEPHHATSAHDRGRGKTSSAKIRAVSEQDVRNQILSGQLDAVCARSPSPGRDALEAMRNTLRPSDLPQLWRK